MPAQPPTSRTTPRTTSRTSLRTSLRAVVVAAVLATGLLTAPAAAPAGAEEPATPHAERVVVDRTMALRDLWLARPRLDGFAGLIADLALARPVDGARDPGGDGYTPDAMPARRRCGPNMCVHWVERGADAPASTRYPARVLRVMERVWRHHVVRLGYRPPLGDGRLGGDSRFDVYLADVGARGLYGYCAPERRQPGQPAHASGYCVLDDDFARDQYGGDPGDALRVTAAHEFFHAVQFAYDVAADPWLMESTATWMEERFADAVDDNRRYLRFGQLRRPGVPLDRYDAAGYAHYGNWLFWESLSDRFGPGVVRRVIEQAGAGGGLPDRHSVAALRTVLAGHGGLPAAYARFAAANTVPGASYPEGATYRGAPVERRRLGTDTRRTRFETRLDHLTSRTVRLRPSPRLATGTRVRIKVLAPGMTAPAARLTLRTASGRHRTRAIALNDQGWGTTSVRFHPGDNGVRWVGVTVVNAGSRYRCEPAGSGDTGYACEGTSRDDRQPVVVKAFLTRPD